MYGEDGNQKNGNASPWTMNLEGIEDPVTVHVVELEGVPSVGTQVEVEGVLSDSVHSGGQGRDR